MSDAKYPIALHAAEAPRRTRPSIYPESLAARVAGRVKRPLGDLFGLSNFGVNHTVLAPGAQSALRHAHTLEDEFVYVLAGHPVLVTGAGETQMAPGMCAGFKAGTGDAHHLVNRSGEEVSYLEIGGRIPADEVDYPDDDLLLVRRADGSWEARHKDGTAY
jgi:uncharacterized cupin superfamily protein